MTQECPQLKNLSPNIRKFWEDKEQTLQDTLLRFSYGVFIEPAEVILREKSGLLYLMRQNLWFEDFPKSSTFSALFEQRSQYTKTQIQIPCASIAEVHLVPAIELGSIFLGKRPSSAGILGALRLFKPRPNTIVLRGTDAAGNPLHCALRDLDGADEWYQALSESSGAKA